MTRPTLPLWWRHCSPAFCLEVPVEGRGEGAGERRGATSRWNDRLSNHKRQRGSPIASALVSATDQRSTSGSEAGAGLELWRDVAALGWRWQVTEAEEEEAKLFQLLPLVSLSRNSYSSFCVFSFHVVVGEGKTPKKHRRLLVRRLIRNGAVSSLEVCEQGSARSLLDFGANTSTTTTKKKVKVKQEKQWRTEKTSMTTFLKVSEQRDVFFFFLFAALLLSQPPASANHLCEQVSPDADM